MVVVVLAVAIGINAQTPEQYRAEIPFSFEAGGRQHSAGEYRVGKIASGAIGLVNLQSGKMRIVGVNAQSGNDWESPATLTFVRTNGSYRLSEISTPSFKIKTKARKIRDNARELALAEQVVKIYLN
jgi:hypothetical protein